MSDPHGTDHNTTDVFRLLTGEASRSESLATAEHIRTCDECQRELVDLVVVHAALTSAARMTRMFASPIEPSGELPPLGPLDDAGHPPSASRDHQQSRRWRWALVVAAVVVLVAVLGTSIGLARNHQASTIVAQATLHPLEGPPNATGSLTALAEGGNRVLTVHTAQLHVLSSRTYYEVWLLDPVTFKMLPVGVLPPSGTGIYDMDASLMNGYSAVDVSLQVNDGNPAHSKVSVLRGYF
jgi:hypothetical protein